MAWQVIGLNSASRERRRPGKVAVPHLNELIDVEHALGAGTVHIVMTMSQTSPDRMYEMYGVLTSTLAKNRKVYADLVSSG